MTHEKRLLTQARSVMNVSNDRKARSITTGLIAMQGTLWYTRE